MLNLGACHNSGRNRAKTTKFSRLQLFFSAINLFKMEIFQNRAQKVHFVHFVDRARIQTRAMSFLCKANIVRSRLQSTADDYSDICIGRKNQFGATKLYSRGGACTLLFIIIEELVYLSSYVGNSKRVHTSANGLWMGIYTYTYLSGRLVKLVCFVHCFKNLHSFLLQCVAGADDDVQPCSRCRRQGHPIQSIQVSISSLEGVEPWANSAMIFLVRWMQSSFFCWVHNLNTRKCCRWVAG